MFSNVLPFFWFNNDPPPPQTLPPLEQKRQQAIQDLIRSEDNYLTDLRFGIERYLTPLNDEILPAEQHEKLFNNIKDVS